MYFNFKNSVYDFLENEKHRLPNFIPVGIGIGIVLYFSADKEPNFLINSIVFISLLSSYFLFKRYRLVLSIFFTISFGFFLSQVRTKTIDTFILKTKSNFPTSLVGTVELSEKTEKGLHLVIESIKSRKYPKLKKISLTWRGKAAMSSEKDYVPGTKVLVYGILSPLTPQFFPGAYDFKKQQYFKGINARIFATKQPKILKAPLANSWCFFIEQLRYRIDQKIEKSLPEATRAVTKALITGNKSEISKEVRSYFANSGTAHLLAISGLHMGIIGFFVFWLFRIFLCCIPRVSMFFNIKKIAAVISWITVLFYLYISGKSIPSIRAFIMHTIVILAILMDRRALTMRSVAIAATIIMISMPEVILFPSFQMSFSAVMAIVALYERFRDFSGTFKTFFSVIATTIVASIPTSIFSINTFNQLTLNSIAANIVSIPLMTFFVMPVAVIALFLMIFGLEQPFIILVGYGVKLLIKISEFSSKLPGSYFVMPTPTSLNMAIFIFSGIILLLIHHKIRFLGLLGLVIGGVFYFFYPTSNIFISPKGKVIGIKTEKCACFNHLGYFRSMSTAWAKSIGFEKREKFNAEGCRQYISRIADNTYSATLNNQKVIITDNPSIPNTILIDKNSDCAEIIYTTSENRLSNKSKERPWS
ncbi:MAG: ComEC family competence protein [Holosporaceae bacterium]|jgi:competence protein ComEC|nr:ComEC family competence protein [Holosporaceae bacterium]